jgi:hypothetical protein
MASDIIEPELIRARRLKGFRAIAMDSKHSTRDLLAAFIKLTGTVVSYQAMYLWRKRQGFVFGKRGGPRQMQSVGSCIETSKDFRKIAALAKENICNRELATRINKILGTDWKRKSIAQWRMKILGHPQPQRNPHNGKAI